MTLLSFLKMKKEECVIVRDVVRKHNYEVVPVFLELQHMELKLPKGWTLKMYVAGACINWKIKDNKREGE